MKPVHVTSLLSTAPSANGTLKVALANGRTAEIPATLKSVVMRKSSQEKQTLSPDTVLPGDCGTSQVDVEAKDNDHPVRMTTGFVVDSPALEYGWEVEITGPDYSYHYSAAGFLAADTSWNGSHDSGDDYPEGDYTAAVATGSYATLANGTICYSGGPVEEAHVDSPDTPIGVRYYPDSGPSIAQQGAPDSGPQGQEARTNSAEDGPVSMEEVPNYADYPNTAVVRLDITWPDFNVATCSGVMIDSRTVATAGHCIYNPALGGWPERIFAIPGKSTAGYPFGICDVVAIGSTDGFVEDNDSDYDYGALRLENNCSQVGNSTGWLDLDPPASQDDDPPTPVTVTGYKSPYKTMSSGTADVEFSTQRQFDYDVETESGVSGAPVYVPGCDGYYCLVGLHSSTVATIARATRITQASMDDFEAWIDGSGFPSG